MFYQSLRAPTHMSQTLTLISASDFQQQYLLNALDSEIGDAHKRFSMHFYHRICGATIYQSLIPVSQSLTLIGVFQQQYMLSHKSFENVYQRCFKDNWNKTF